MLLLCTTQFQHDRTKKEEMGGTRSPRGEVKHTQNFGRETLSQYFSAKILWRRRYFSLLQSVKPGSGALPRAYSVVPRIKRPRREVYLPHASIYCEVKNERSYISAPPICHHDVHRKSEQLCWLPFN
jgi:hypothetical protein